MCSQAAATRKAPIAFHSTALAASKASSSGGNSGCRGSFRKPFLGEISSLRPSTATSALASPPVVRPRAELGDSLEEFLVKATSDTKLRQLMTSMAECARTIAFNVRTASCAAQGCTNSFGDEQLAVDLVADKLLFEALTYSHVCEFACSEENPEPIDCKGQGYSVAFDPLDGSSIVDTNFTVGTVFGVWPGGNLKGIKGSDMAASGIAIYGPRTVFCITIKGFPGTHEFLLMAEGKWTHVKETTEIGEGKLFSPGNLRATFDNPEYEKLINFYIEEKYTLRYTGGMVPDVFQIIVKEKGVFTNVISASTKAKLRILFEVAPLALLVEQAGGHSSCDGKCISALDVEIEDYDQRSQVCFGSKEEVRRFEEYLYGKSPRFSALQVS